MKYRVRLTREAEQDLLELAQKDEGALDTIRKAFELLESFPFSCRKAAGATSQPLLREMVTGQVALFEIEQRHVTILAVRHQREDDSY